ncbi:hypothetical protein BC936DRAFT_142318 [Jimgerdemannia flammicorona]|uniref:Uncharacterized protein n=2 Tax=Jimgerdemannia flammicorona TaxID=994334 RepID=A0A433DFB9_9FUNG|nr:hypothetical protein BC936DRAFT_142318 [Jimgerdemannia flammicorona]RUS34455.1 hypothetical protein BC938DRAFT_480325 [Jimgerdemannia flammicorona]
MALPKQSTRGTGAEPLRKTIGTPQSSFKQPRTPTENQRRHLECISNAYRGNYAQGAMLLQIIRLNAKRLITERMIVETTKHILRTWEPETLDPVRSVAFAKFVHFFVNKTALNFGDLPLETAIVMSCVSRSAVPIVCPTVTLVMAMGYIDRLRKKHPAAVAQSGSTQRLFLMAYIIAAKYIHSTLGTVIATSSLPRNLNFPSSSPLPPTSINIPRNESFLPRQQPTPSSPPTTPTRSDHPQLRFTIKIPLASSRSHHLPPLVTKIMPQSNQQAPDSPPTTPTYVQTPSSPLPQPQPRPAQYLHTPSHILTSTTPYFATLLPRTTPQELTRMELEFLHFLDYDLAVHSDVELRGWWERCGAVEGPQVVPDCGTGFVANDSEAAGTEASDEEDNEVPNM